MGQNRSKGNIVFHKHILFLCPPVYTGGHIVFALSVGWLVCWLVCANINICYNFCHIAHSYLIFGMHVYLMDLHILSGEWSRSRSSFKVAQVKYMGQNRSFHSHFCTIHYTNLIFGMHVYLMDLHVLSGEWSRSRSSFKVAQVKYMGQNSSFHSHFMITQERLGLGS